MNRNNSSSAIKVDELDDFKTSSYDSEIQRLKCENFQLRLTCYNYECTLNEIEANSKNDDLSTLKRSFEQKIISYNYLEDQMKTIQIENIELKRQLEEYFIFQEQRSMLSMSNNGTQTTLQCMECFNHEVILQRATEEFSQKIAELECVNQGLFCSLMETKSLIKNIDTFEVSCNTVPNNIFYPSNESLDDLKSESYFDPGNQIGLQPLIEKTLIKLNDFLTNYQSGENKIKHLENNIVSTFQQNFFDETITNDSYKLCLFKDAMFYSDDKYVQHTMQQCRDQLINNDYQIISEYLSDSDYEKDDDLTTKISEKNPNILVINSILEKLNQRSDEIKNLNKKIKMNKKWCKNVSLLKECKEKSNIETDIREEINIHIDQITELSSTFATMIPAINITFSKTIEYLKTVRMLQIEKMNISMINCHQTNERFFLDNCNVFIQSTSNCLLALDKEKMFLNSANQLFPAIYIEDPPHPIEVEVLDESVLEVVIQPSALSQDTKATSPDNIVKHDMNNQTFDYQLNPSINLCLSHQPGYSIKPYDNDCIEENDESSTHTEISNETFTIEDNHCFNKVQEGRMIIAGAYGDVISDCMTYRNVNSDSFSIKHENKDYKLRSASVISFKNCDNCMTDQDDLYSLQDLNNSNTSFKSQFNNVISNIKNGATKSSDSISRIRSSEIKKTKTLSDNSSLRQSPSDVYHDYNYFQDQPVIISNILSHMRLRIMKLLYIHDFKMYVQALSKKDLYIAEEFSNIKSQLNNITQGNRGMSSSKLFLDLQKSVNQWNKDVADFNNTTQKCVPIPNWLLAVSDSELVQLLFVQHDSKLDFTISGEEKVNSDCELFVSLEYLVEDLRKHYESIDGFGNHIIKQNESIYHQINEDNNPVPSNIIVDKERQISELLQYSETLKEQYKESVLKNTNLHEKIAQITNEKEIQITELTSDIDVIKGELSKLSSEKMILANVLDTTIQENSTRKKETQDEINQLILRNENLKEELNILLSNSLNLNNAMDLLKSENNFLSKDNEKLKNTVNNNDVLLLDVQKANENLQKQLCIIKEHEIQLLNNLKHFENSEQMINDRISQLTLDLQNSSTKIREQEKEISKYLNEKLEMEESVSRLEKEIYEFNDTNDKFHDENKRLHIELSAEKTKSKDLHKHNQSLDSELKNAKLEIKLQKEDFQSGLDKLKKYETFKLYFVQFQKKFLELINRIIDAITNTNSSISRNSLELKLRTKLIGRDDNTDEVKKISNITCMVDEIVTLLQNEVLTTKERRFLSMREKFVQVNILNKSEVKSNKVNIGQNIYREFIGRRYFNERYGDIDTSYSAQTFLKPPSRVTKKQYYHSMAGLVTNLKDSSNSVKHQHPIPAPRLKLHQFNENNADDKTTFSLLDSKKEKQADEHEKTFSLSEDYDNTSRISEHITLPMDTQISNNADEENTQFKESITFDMVHYLLIRLHDDDAFQDSEEFQELCNIVRFIDCDQSSVAFDAQKNILLSNPYFINDKCNIEKLIDTNRYLTNNLMKTTKKLLTLQDRIELLNTGLRQTQLEKHEMSLELASKYERLTEIQKELENLNGHGNKSHRIDSTTQTNKPKSSYGEFESGPLKVKNLSMLNEHSSAQRNEVCSPNSSFTISKSEDIPSFPKSDNVSHFKPKVDDDWDDVTRTMIRCLTTLSDVQETLVTPTLDEDTFPVAPVKDSAIYETESNADFSFSKHDKSKVSTNTIVNCRINVALIKEGKYQIIRQLIHRIKDSLPISNGNKTKESDATKTILQMIHMERLIKKIISVFNNNIIIRELPACNWETLLENKQLLNIVPYSMVSTDCNLHNNPLEATERVQNDIVRLQQRLERYQRRYKSLKNAVMANKYKFNESQIPNIVNM